MSLMVMMLYLNFEGWIAMRWLGKTKMEEGCNFTSICLTSPSSLGTSEEQAMAPKSPPPGLLDFYGKRKQMVKIKVLEREIALLQVCITIFYSKCWFFIFSISGLLPFFTFPATCSCVCYCVQWYSEFLKYCMEQCESYVIYSSKSHFLYCYGNWFSVLCKRNSL